MTAAIVTIGDEILIGQIVDTNASWIANQLADIGIQTSIKLTVGDDLEKIIGAIDRASQLADVLILTGGLGPTKDDLTKKALAEYMGCGFVFSEPMYNRIVQLFEKRNIPVAAAHREQCYLPAAATMLENKMGTAPGLRFNRLGKTLFSIPGVPHEMKYLMTHHIVPWLSTRNENIFLKKTIKTSGIGESVLADLIEPVLKNHEVKVAYLPAPGQVRIRLSVDGMKQDADAVEDSLNAAIEDVEAVLGIHKYGFDDDTLEFCIGKQLMDCKLTIGTAESCTGGYIAHMITGVPGASHYFKGSVIAYNNEVKQDLLGVKASTLAEFGAVSGETVREMATGAISSLSCDIAIAVSGVAGPSGGSKNKPVGTVWIAVGDENNQRVKSFLFTKDRLLNIKYTGVYALDMLRKFLSAR